MGRSGLGELDALAQRFMPSVTGEPASQSPDMYSPTWVSWHNTDEAELPIGAEFGESISELARLELEAIRRLIPDYHLEAARYHVHPDGFVITSIACGTTVDGRAFRMPMCFLYTVVDGVVARVDEYLDSKQAGPLAEALVSIVDAVVGLRREPTPASE